ncbi:MAG TPA: hypothetical protein VMT38_06160 [Terracidiphilus sp.]|nr:hypothetical protein [Terracidiphilus sp.]
MQPLSRLACSPFLMLTVVVSFCLTSDNNHFAAAAQSADAGSCATVPDGNLSQAQIAQFESVEAGLKDREAQANHDYANDKLRCKADPKPSTCIMTAQKKFQNTETDIQEDRDRNDANRQEAEIDAGAARDECNVTGQTPAEKQENLRHFKALIALKKKNVDVQVSYNIAKLACEKYSEGSPPDSGGAISSDKHPPDDPYNYLSKPAGCVSEAEKEYKADQINLQADANDEDFLHTKNLAAIQK